MLRVCTFESRRSEEMLSLIQRQGATAVSAPSLKEIRLDENSDVLKFGEELLSGQIDIVLFLTGVGAQAMLDVLVTRWSMEAIAGALSRTMVLVRGPKPVGVLRSCQIKVDYRAPEPNTWREVVSMIDSTPIPIAGQVVALQEYGQPQVELTKALRDRLAEVRSVPVYKWALPDDLAPLEAAIRSTIAGDLDVLLFTSAQQAVNTLDVADRLGLRGAWVEAARKCVIGSIGPTATETLESLGLRPDLEPSHGKMGHLVIETLALARSARR